MPVRRNLLDQLPVQALRELAVGHCLPVTDRRRRDHLCAALLAHEGTTAAGLSELLTVPRLRLVCQSLGLPSQGRRAELVRRLLEHDAAQQAAAGRAAGGAGLPLGSMEGKARPVPSAPSEERPAGAAAQGSRRRAAQRQRPADQAKLPPFVAIDFETANRYRDSACSVGLVRVEDGRVQERRQFLIRPPQRWFEFTYIHGISWSDVANSPDFGEVWREAQYLLEDTEFLAAHNAPFDSSVLRACCQRYGLDLPPQPFRCTLRLARRTFPLQRFNLAAVCQHLQVPLLHHDALSDAEGCARIVLAASGLDHRTGLS